MQRTQSGNSGCRAVRFMAARERRDLVAVAAARHRTPTAAVRPRHVRKEEPATRIGADAEAGGRSFEKNLRSGTSDGRQEPIQAVFAGHKLQTPFAVFKHKFVMSLGNAQNFINGFDPFPGDSLFTDRSVENLTERLSEAPYAGQQSIGSCLVRFREVQKEGAALRRDHASNLKKPDEFFQIG